MATGEYKNLNNYDYWEKRSLEIVEAKWKKEGAVEKALAQQFTASKAEIRKEILDFYMQYGKDNKISYTEAITQLNQTELSDYKATMERLYRQAPTDAIQKQIQLMRDAKKVNRLQSLSYRLDAELLNLGYSQQITIEESLEQQYTDTYYETGYALSTGVGVGINFNMLQTTAVVEAITYPLRGVMFSDAIWDNRTLLVKNLRKTITDGIIKGESNQKMARNLAAEMDSNYKNALRIIRTETAKVVNQATIKGYEDTDFLGAFYLIATLDSRTSSICQRKDGNVVQLKDAVLGDTLPPFHVHCRTAVAPYFGSDDLSKSTRIARDAEGKNIHVPGDMKYQEWFDTYIKE